MGDGVRAAAGKDELRTKAWTEFCCQSRIDPPSEAERGGWDRCLADDDDDVDGFRVSLVGVVVVANGGGSLLRTSKSARISSLLGVMGSMTSLSKSSSSSPVSRACRFREGSRDLRP